MLELEHDIRVGRYRIGMVDSVTVKKSVETLCDTATIVLPATYVNKSIDVESKLAEGDAVAIRLGYGDTLQTEFEGFLSTVKTDDDKVTLECEDALYHFRKELRDAEHKNISVNSLLQTIAGEVDTAYTVECDYDFVYDKFVVKDAMALDVLKKVQDETKANIYFNGKTLHVHPQYSEIANSRSVVYDFAVNVEKSALKWKRADERKYFVEVEGVKPDGERVTVTFGKPGGEKRCIKVYGVTDKNSLLKRAKEELATVVYSGFEGNFTGWLVPYCAPSYKVMLRDGDCPEKNGNYYVVATETKFAASGGERVVTIGKKIG